MRWLLLVMMVVNFSALAGCSSTPKVERVDVDEVIDLSGNWNDADAIKTAKVMIEDVLAKPWYEKFIMDKGRLPTVIIGHVANKTYEHINSQIFTKYLEKELLNSGKVVFVASPEEREQIRGERDDQHKGYTDPETMAQIGKEIGADFMLIGSMNSEKDEVKKKFVVLYQVNLELIDLNTNQKVWMGQNQIKKTAEKSRFSL